MGPSITRGAAIRSAEGRDEGQRFPVTVRDGADQALADLLKGEVRFFSDQPEKPILVRQKLGLDAAGLALAPHPFDRRRRARLKALRSGARRAAGVDPPSKPAA